MYILNVGSCCGLDCRSRTLTQFSISYFSCFILFKVPLAESLGTGLPLICTGLGGSRGPFRRSATALFSSAPAYMGVTSELKGV